jgi:hypothetical protein
MIDGREPFDDTFRGRCAAAQKQLWEKAARMERRDLSDWIRIQLDDAAARQLQATGEKSARPKR